MTAIVADHLRIFIDHFIEFEVVAAANGTVQFNTHTCRPLSLTLQIILFPLAAMAPQHLVRSIHEALCLRNAGSKLGLTLFDFLRLFGPALGALACIRHAGKFIKSDCRINSGRQTQGVLRHEVGRRQRSSTPMSALSGLT